MLGRCPARENAAAPPETVPWYHTIELPTGPTPGEYDLRKSVNKLPFPPTLEGRRCLDVGTHDGFWAFEMERRRAAEVVAIDIRDPEEIDWPEPRPAIDLRMREFLALRKQKFQIAHEALRSNVVHLYVSVTTSAPASQASSTSCTSAACCSTCATQPAR